MLTADMDGVVGEMVAALKTKEMWADTLWFFQSDNGRSDHCPSFSRPFLALRCLPLQFCCPPLWPKINMRSNVTNHPQVLHTSTGTCTDKTCLMLGPERHLRHVHLRLLRRPERPVSSSRRQCIRATEEMARKVDQTAVDSSLWRRRPAAGTPAPAVHSRNRRDGTQGGDRT